MKKFVMKKNVIGLCAIICAGGLLFTGCAGTEVKTDAEVKTGTEVKTDAEKREVSNTQDSNAANNPAAADEKKEDTFVDGNDLMNSADLYGPASGCTDTGCTINPDSFVSVDDDGSVSSRGEGSTNVVYTEETVFQKGTIKSDGSSYSLQDSDKDKPKDNDYILCFGKQQEDGTYLADRIIVITFNYN